MLELDFCHLRFAIRACTHIGEYSILVDRT
jgi:hypothetical protein